MSNTTYAELLTFAIMHKSAISIISRYRGTYDVYVDYPDTRTVLHLDKAKTYGKKAFLVKEDGDKDYTHASESAIDFPNGRGKKAFFAWLDNRITKLKGYQPFAPMADGSFYNS